MLHGLESEPSAFLKYDEETSSKVWCPGLWVNPTLPACSPDGLVGKDTVTEIKSLKIFKQYSVQDVTALTSTIPKEVLSRQWFCVKDGKCVLKRTHGYYYQCQHILLVRDRKFCDFILYSANGPDSVERIARDQPLIAKISEYLTAFWMRVVAPEIFEMRIPRELLPFILPQLNPDGIDDMGAVNTDIFPSASPGNSRPLYPLTETQGCVVNPSHAESTYTQEEICAADALLNVLNNPMQCMSSVSHHQDHDLTFFPWGGVTSTGISLTNTCPLDNWIVIFQALVHSGRVDLVDPPESGDTIARVLQLVTCGLHADAKLLVIQSLRPQPQATSGTLDLYGNEGDFSIKLLNPHLMSTTTSTCCSVTCPNPVQAVHYTSLILPLPTTNISGENTVHNSQLFFFT